jgi:ectoine hydroxylase-related dioxygenase (phytanoyl-CoA dioxygenase family)
LLTDVRRDGGGFQCLPEIYRDLDAWLRKHATKDDFNFFEPGLNDLETVQVEGQAGDVILWSTLLPHGSAANQSDRPRMAAFVTLQPPADYEQLRNSLMTWWLTKRAPDQWRGMPGQIDPEPGAPAALSELGQKLIGARPW